MRIFLADSLLYLAAALFCGLIFLPLDPYTLRFGFISTPWIFVALIVALVLAAAACALLGDPYLGIKAQEDSKEEDSS